MLVTMTALLDVTSFLLAGVTNVSDRVGVNTGSSFCLEGDGSRNIFLQTAVKLTLQKFVIMCLGIRKNVMSNSDS
jgi:hypothetical protein